jgi:hypothetical protein
LRNQREAMTATGTEAGAVTNAMRAMMIGTTTDEKIDATFGETSR